MAENNKSPLKQPFSLVESIPIGTQLGDPALPRTKTVWLDMIQQAKSSLAIGAFYFSNVQGEGMTAVIQAIKTAANRGVKVRIIIGQLFKKETLKVLAPLKNNPNIHIRVLPMHDLTGGVMHAKYMVADQQRSYVGSANFDWRALNQIHELGVYIDNKRFAQTLLYSFNFDWDLVKYKKFTFLPVTAERPIVLTQEGKPLVIHPAFSPASLTSSSLNNEEQQMLQLIKNARHTISMQVLEYSPLKAYGNKGYWPALENALHHAAARGVKVKLIVSDWALKKAAIPFLKSLALTPNIEVKISTIPQLAGKFIPYARVEHCKYFIVDNDLSWIGTGNWQWSYFHNTRDIAVIIFGEQPANTLQKIFNRDWHGPYVQMLDVTKHYKKTKVS